MLRLKSNCSVTLVVPRLLDDVISVTPAILPNCRSSGVATEEAMISGLAPGKLAPTEIVGKSTCGRGETGNTRNATAPASAIAAVSSAVATGLRINGEERLIFSVETGLAPSAAYSSHLSLREDPRVRLPPLPAKQTVAPAGRRRCKSPESCTA